MGKLPVACILLLALPALGHGQSLGSAAQKEDPRKAEPDVFRLEMRAKGTIGKGVIRGRKITQPYPSPARRRRSRECRTADHWPAGLRCGTKASITRRFASKPLGPSTTSFMFFRMLRSRVKALAVLRA